MLKALLVAPAESEVEPMPRSRQVIIDASGLIPYTRKRLLEQAAA